MDKRKKEILDALLEKASTLEKEMPIYVEISKDVTPTNKDGKEVMENEFYTRGNEGKSDGDVNTLEPEKDFVRLTVPAGEKIAYIEDDGKSLLLLRRNATYHITKTTEVNDDSGNSHNIYEAELIPKEEIVVEARDFHTNKGSAEKWGEDNYKKWLAEISAEETTAIKYYTGEGYDKINAYLRMNEGKRPTFPFENGEKKVVRLDAIGKIDAALEKAAIPEAIIVYKRVSEWIFNHDSSALRKNTENVLNTKIKDEIIAKYQGKTFEEKGFMSTSLSQDPSREYGPERYNILLKIHIPKGTHAAYIESISRKKEQLELLIKRGYTFKYEKFSVIKDAKGRESLMVEISLQTKSDK
ncbi:ADP-ribosyltransferase [Bacillus cereus]